MNSTPPPDTTNVDHLGVAPPGLRVASGVDPAADDGFEFLCGFSGVRRGDDLEQAALAGSGDRFHVSFDHAFEWLCLFPLRVLRRERLDAIEREGQLCVDRLLHPKRAVLVE